MSLQLRILLLISGLSFLSCDRTCRVPVHYAQLGCTPIADPKGGCPKSYNCAHVWSRSKDVCYGDFGTQFAVGDSFPYPINMTAHYVFTTFAYFDTCTCKPKTVYGPASIECQQIMFPPHRRRVSASEAVCTVNGEFFREGDQIFKRDTSDCTKTFCRKFGVENIPMSCGFGLFTHFQFLLEAIPSYGFGQCCPVRWRTLRGDEVIVPAKKPVASDSRCKVGSLLLRLGESLPFDRDTCSDCRCDLPPMLTCVIDESCTPLLVE